MFHLTRYQKGPHLQEKDMPVACIRTCHVALSKAEAAVKTEVSEIWHSFTWKNRTLGSLGPSERRDFPKRLMNRKAGCYTLLKRITVLKCVNSEVKSVDINPTKEVPSIGSMAPCRSHHGNHTRQEWIIIWSGRNWILKHAKPRNRTIR